MKYIIDGSNVAYGSGRPLAENISNMIKYLKKHGINDIIVICDASLRHKVIDKDHFENLVKLGIINIAPAGVRADEFIIDYAKMNNAMIITNDRFNDFRNDPWVRENIDNYLVQFMFIEREIFIRKK